MEDIFNNIENSPNTERIDIEKEWTSFKYVVEECVEKREMTSKRRINKEMWLEKRDSITKQDFKRTVRETTKLCRRKKREWLNQMVAKAEADRTANNTKDFYRTIRFFKKGFTPNAYGIKNKDGKLVIQNEEALEIWQDYFKKLLNVETAENIEESPELMNVQPDIEEPSKEEVKEALKSLKRNEAPGVKFQQIY